MSPRHSSISMQSLLIFIEIYGRTRLRRKLQPTAGSLLFVLQELDNMNKVQNKLEIKIGDFLSKWYTSTGNL